MSQRNEVGQDILFKHENGSNARIELARFTGGSQTVNLSAFDPDGALALYMGLTDQDAILALSKAILNAMEPEALVENQKDAEPEQQYDVPALVASVADLEDRVAALEAAADTEIRVGDTVRVAPADWNIDGAWAGHETLTGEVIWVADSGYTGPSKYLVRATPSRGENAGVTHSIYALKATKVVSRG